MWRMPQTEMEQSGIEVSGEVHVVELCTANPPITRKTRGGGPLVLLQQLFLFIEDTVFNE